MTDKAVITISGSVLSYAGVPCRDTAVTVTVSEEEPVMAPSVYGENQQTTTGGSVPYGTPFTLQIPEGAEVYYTTDGSDPSPTNGIHYIKGQEIIITKSMTLKAVAVKYGQFSPITTVIFTVDTGSTNPPGQTTPPSGNGGGYGSGGSTGGGSGSSYSVSVPASSSIKNGSIDVSPRTAKKGDTVTITVKPDPGYELDTLTVTDSKGSKLTLTDAGNGRYTFTMPASKVDIKVSFKESAPAWENCTGGGNCPAHSFPDVNPAEWYHRGVDYVLVNGIMRGYDNGLFGPNDNLSRAQLCQVLYNLEGKPAVSGGSAFQDVKQGSWYCDAVTWATKQNIVLGYGDGKFGPDDSITREQMATLLYRYASWKGSSTAARGDLSRFTDSAQIGSWAKDAMNWACAEELVNGTSTTTLSPQGLASRAQVATVLMRYIQNVLSKQD